MHFNRSVTLFIIFLLLSAAVFAHEGHKKKMEKKPDTLTIVGDDTIAVNGIPIESFTAKNIAVAETENAEYPEEEPKEVTIGAAFQHLHNKLIHFPIALTVIAFLLMILGYKDEKYLGTVKIIVPLAAILTIATVLTGQAQAEPFEGTSAYALVETHKKLGFGVLASLILWSIVMYVEKLKKFAWVFAILTAALVGIAGLYGGVIAH